MGKKDCNHTNMVTSTTRMAGVIIGEITFCQECGKVKDEWFGSDISYQNWEEL